MILVVCSLKTLMKNSSFCNGRAQAFIDGFYYMALIYFSLKHTRRQPDTQHSKNNLSSRILQAR